MSSVEPIITHERAMEMAEIMYAGNPEYYTAYWPKTGVAVGDFDFNRLIPALSLDRIQVGAWNGAEAFLRAARQDRARAIRRWNASDLAELSL